MGNNIQDNPLFKTGLTEEKLVIQIIHLRTAVLALGETSEPPWWRTGFLNTVGMRFLERLYPRTNFMATLNAAGKAASDAHDRAVGKVGTYHLFRLSQTLEGAVHSILKISNASFVDQYVYKLGNEKTLLEHLKAISDSELYEGGAGAIKIGAERDMNEVHTFKKAAAIYYSAFQQKGQVFPYFDIERGGKN